MPVVQVLQENYYELIEDTIQHLFRADLDHYCDCPREENNKRATDFLDLMIGSLEQKDLRALLEYVEKLSADRFNDGYGLTEVQRAFNGLKKEIWKRVVENLEPEYHAKALGLINTTIDEAKDLIANRYVFYSLNGTDKKQM